MRNSILPFPLCTSWFLFISGLFSLVSLTESFSLRDPTSTKQQQPIPIQPVGDILILDHLNINHEKGRHDWLKAFYFDYLKLAVDPRKEENLQAGKKTVWANAGANQFHLPEGKPSAQVLEGIVTLVYPDLEPLRTRVTEVQPKLRGSLFAVEVDDDDNNNTRLLVTDPWGTKFNLVQGAEEERDPRGKQPGALSECLGMRDLTIYTPKNCNMEGIARFYSDVLGAPIIGLDAKRCVVSVGPRQTMTFSEHPGQLARVEHEDLRDEQVNTPEGSPAFLSNYGPHVSMYVTDLPSCYKKAEALGVAYVNPRFKRRAYNLEESIDDCMFRCLDIIDPENIGDGVILRLEHEIRSVVKRDGSKYKSCPFDNIPDSCASI